MGDHLKITHIWVTMVLGWRSQTDARGTTLFRCYCGYGGLARYGAFRTTRPPTKIRPIDCQFQPGLPKDDCVQVCHYVGRRVSGPLKLSNCDSRPDLAPGTRLAATGISRGHWPWDARHSASKSSHQH